MLDPNSTQRLGHPIPSRKNIETKGAATSTKFRPINFKKEWEGSTERDIVIILWWVPTEIKEEAS